MQAVDLQPIRREEQTQSPTDLFLIFVGANIVATTLQVGASLPAAFDWRTAAGVIATGSVAGALLVALLAPVGPRLRVPSIVAARASLGMTGAAALALLLFVTNFAWIALNNVIAASVAAKVTGTGHEGPWAVGFGILATLVVLGGPRAAAYFDRLAVPLLGISGVVFTVACLRAPWPAWPTAAASWADVVRGFDIVTGYQVSWLLMFADYPRYVRSGPRAAGAVFLGLALTALWFIPLGFVAAALARSSDPGAMVAGLGIGLWGAVLITFATLTTNFVNIYMSALAFKSLRPSISDRANVWTIGGVGAALSVLSNAWIEQFANFTLILASALVPIGGILLAHFVLLRVPTTVTALYDVNGPHAARRGWSLAGTMAWLAGIATFQLSQPIGATLPTLAVSIAVYAVLHRATFPAR